MDRRVMSCATCRKWREKFNRGSNAIGAKTGTPTLKNNQLKRLRESTIGMRIEGNPLIMPPTRKHDNPPNGQLVLRHLLDHPGCCLDGRRHCRSGSDGAQRVEFSAYRCGGDGHRADRTDRVAVRSRHACAGAAAGAVEG